jgi:hypothetical protein
LVVNQEIKILAKTKQAGNYPQIFAEYLGRQNSEDIFLLRQNLLFSEPASGRFMVSSEEHISFQLLS